MILMTFVALLSVTGQLPLIPAFSVVHHFRRPDTESKSSLLKLVILIHRHGDRTPIGVYPRDPYKNQTKYWPDGWGQLTINGKNRMYHLGEYLAKRYNGFLGASPREVYARSSGLERCLESASMILAGLYPPQGRWRWNDKLGQKWQPFPIQTVPQDDDGMLNPGSKCRKAEEIKTEIYRSPMVMKYHEMVKPTLIYVQDNAGYKDEIDLIQAERIFDALYIESAAKLPLPAWVDHSLFEKLGEISAKTFVFSGLTPEIQRLRTGLLLADIWQHLANQDPEKRLILYSTHDTQLSVFLSALDAFNGLAPPFGASILLELYADRENSSSQYLEAYYLNVTESERPYPLPLNRCQITSISDGQQRCTLEAFHQSIKDLIPDDWRAECGDDRWPACRTEDLGMYLVLATIMLTILVMCSFLFLLMNNRRHLASYRLLSQVSS